MTGVKGCIVDKIQSILRDDAEFIAAHPMAGRERSGIEFADSSIFKVANYIVTPNRQQHRKGHRALQKTSERRLALHTFPSFPPPDTTK